MFRNASLSLVKTLSRNAMSLWSPCHYRPAITIRKIGNATPASLNQGGCCPPPVIPNQNCCPPPSTTCRPPAVAINGFGRIGKCLLRLALKADNINVVAVNQPFTDLKTVAHSLRLDTVHGPFPGTINVKQETCTLCVNGKGIRVFHEEKPEKLKWKDLGIDYVIDSTGKFTKIESATKHITAGAKKVIITAPSGDAPMFVRGVNFCEYKKAMSVVSNSSCTTNCAAPLIHIINKKFGVVNCLLTTTHAMTASQHVHDGLCYRSAPGNIVPSTTGAAKAVGKVIPELKDVIDGDAARVPTLDVSLLKLYINCKEKVSVDSIKCEIKSQAQCAMKGLISYYDSDKYVSSDFIGSPYSAIVDFSQIRVIDKFITIGAWYDNEMGYSNRVLDLLRHMMEEDRRDG